VTPHTPCLTQLHTLFTTCHQQTRQNRNEIDT